MGSYKFTPLYSWMNTENSSSEMFPPRAVCPLLCKIFALLRVSWVSENTVPRGCLVSALARSCGSQGVSVCINQELAPHITQELLNFKEWEKSKQNVNTNIDGTYTHKILCMYVPQELSSTCYFLPYTIICYHYYHNIILVLLCPSQRNK